MRIVCGIATTNERSETLDKTVISLLPQVDELIVYNNDEMSKDYTDLAKFWGLTRQKEPCYYFSCDDDIIYPSDYVEKTVDYIDATECIISWHGRQLPDEFENYYDIEGFRFFQEVREPKFLDVSGTGVTAFRTDLFNPAGIHEQPYKRMADLVFSLAAWKQDQKILRPPTNHLWIKPQETIGIFQTFKGRPQGEQNRLAKEILRCKNG